MTSLEEGLSLESTYRIQSLWIEITEMNRLR